MVWRHRGVAAPQTQRVPTAHARGCLWCEGFRYILPNTSERGGLPRHRTHPSQIPSMPIFVKRAQDHRSQNRRNPRFFLFFFCLLWVGRGPPPSHALRVGRRWDVRAAPNTPCWPDQGPAGRRDPSSEPVLAAGCVFGVLKCDCIDTRRPPRCTCGCFGAACEIGAPTIGQKDS